MRNLLRTALCLAVMTGPASLALALPVIQGGGNPGVSISWKTEGGVTVLKIKAGFDAAVVAQAIKEKIPGVTVKPSGDTVAVSGMPEAKLLLALEGVDVPEGDDVDSVLANLRSVDGGDEESGSSIRATQAADFSGVMGKKEELLTAKVVEVKHQKFPLVLVTVKITQIPKGLAIAGVKNGSKITVLPRVKSKNGMVDPKDEASQLNLGAWYVEAGDTVLLRLEGGPKDNVWIAAAFDRRVK
jgi:hypothetical protein